MRRQTATVSPGAVAPLLILCLLLASCATDLTIEQGPERPDRPQDTVVDIQVIQESKRLVATNTTGRDFGPSRVWVNQWFSQDIPGFAPGQRLELALGEFRDVYGDEFRGGGFFAAEDPDKVVKVELETPLDAPEGEREIVGLIVVGSPGELR